MFVAGGDDGAGTITVRSSQLGDTFFNPAIPVDQPLEVAQARQIIHFPSIGDKRAGDLAIPLTATATSGLPVTFAVVSGPATLQGTQLSVTEAGSITIRASQVGDSNYNPAPDEIQTFSAQSLPAPKVILSNDEATFSWPSIAIGFILESTRDLAPSSWSVATPAPVVVGGQTS